MVVLWDLMGKPWENHGKTMGNIDETVDLPIFWMVILDSYVAWKNQLGLWPFSKAM